MVVVGAQSRIPERTGRGVVEDEVFVRANRGPVGVGPIGRINDGSQTDFGDHREFEGTAKGMLAVAC